MEEKSQITDNNLLAKYGTIFNAVNDAILIYDIESNMIIDVNEKACEMFCYPREELLRMSVLDLGLNEEPYTNERAREFIKRASDGEPQLFEWAGKDKAGRPFWIDINLRRAVIGGKYCLLSVVRDINDRKQAEQAVEENERFLENIFNSIQDGISILDKDMNIVRVNPVMEQWYSHAMPLIGKKCYEAYHSRDRRCDKCPTHTVLSTGKPGYEVVPRCGESGVVVGWQDLYSFPMFDSITGELTGAIEYVRDISDRMKAEEALGRTKEQIQLYLGIAGVMIVAMDTQGKTTLINKRGCDLLQYKEDEIVGKDWFDNFVPERLRTEVRGVFQKLVKGEIEEAEYFENPIKTKTGEERMIAWHNTSIRDSQGGIITILSSGEDITDRKIAEEKLKLLNEELVKSNEKLKQMALKDVQTGLFNHNYLDDIIERELLKAKRYAHHFSIIMLDIDYFKSINDLYGHKFGDMILKQFASYLKKIVRRYDVVVRFGGEEFIIVSSNVNRHRSVIIARRILDAVNLYNFGDSKETIKLKLSMAIASYPDDKASRGIDLINLADKILNKAKEDGGNRVYSSLDLKGERHVTQEMVVTPADIEFLKLKDKIAKLTKHGRQNLIESIFAFAKTIELRDHYTGSHVESTVRYATDVAKALKLQQEDIENIREAAALHDLGKVGISDKILHKKAKLTKKEFEEIRRHPQIAADIIRPIKFMHDIIPLILYHHERWDGKGYPVGLQGEEIPIGSRIIAIADVYQALTSDRPYRKAYRKNKAIEIIKKGSGVQFDPRIVDMFLKIVAKEKIK